MRPYFETLFRSPHLIILPAVFLPAVVLAALLILPATYSTSATLWVDRAILEPYSGGPVMTASAEEARAFQDRLDTVSFRRQVIEDAGLAPLVEAMQWPEPTRPGTWLADIGVTPLASRLGGTAPLTVEAAWERASDAVFGSITVEDRGENLILVTYTGSDRVHAQSLLYAATNNYLREKANAAQRKVDDSNRVHSPLVAALEIEVETARQSWVNFTASLPLVPSATQEQQAAEFESTYRDGVARLEEMRLNQASATMSAVTEWTNKSPSATLVDAPHQPQPGMGLFGMVKFTIMGVVAGSFLGGVLVVFRTWLDGMVRTPEEIEARLGTPVVAVLPLLGESRTAVERGR